MVDPVTCAWIIGVIVGAVLGAITPTTFTGYMYGPTIMIGSIVGAIFGVVVVVYQSVCKKDV